MEDMQLTVHRLKLTSFMERVAMKIPTRSRIQGAHFCKYCGTKVPKDAVYCPLCGRPSLLLHHLTELILESL
jgi:hypothetical protein